MDFGERLRVARERQGLLQKDAAALLNIAGPQLSRYEKNVNQPVPEQIRAMAQLYNVSADYLLGVDRSFTSSHGVTVINEDVDPYYADLSALSGDKRKVVQQLIKYLVQGEQ